MSVIVKKWVMTITGETLDNAAITLKCSNGFLIAQILYGLNVIQTTEFNWIQDYDDEETADANFHLLRTWLTNVGIDLTDELIDDLKNYNESSTASLLFKLYLNTNDHNVLYYETEHMKREQNIYVTHSRFDVERVRRRATIEKDDDTDDEISEATDFVNPHIKYMNVIKKTKRHIFKWYSTKTRSTREQTVRLRDECRARLKQLFETRAAVPPATVDVRSKRRESRRFSLSLNTTTTTAATGTACTSIHDGEDLVHKVRAKATATRNRNLFVTRNVQKQIVSLFRNAIDELDAELEAHVVNNKLTKRSNYEKQMIQRLYEAYGMKNIVMEHHMHYVKKADYYKTWLDFTLNLRHKDRYIFAYELYCHEVARNKQLHVRLAEEVRALHAIRVRGFCADVLRTIVDYALRLIAFHEDHQTHATYTQTMYWKACFIKGISFDNYIDDLFDLITYDDDDEAMDAATRTAHRLQMDKEITLNNYIMEHYFSSRIYFYLPYAEDVVDEIQERIERTNVIVSKLLRTFKSSKYPPLTKDKPPMPPFKVRVCILGLTDQTVLPVLKKLMDHYRIAIVEMEQAINYCMRTYLTEDPNFDVEHVFMDMTSDTLDWLSNVDKNPIFKDKRKRWRLIDGSVEKTSKDERREKKAKADKANQAPNEDNVKLSAVGELGRLAYLYLYAGAHLPNKCAISMFVEYLKTLADHDGWLLINFPLTIKDAVYMEECLTGVKFGRTFKKHFEIDNIVDAEWRTIESVPLRDAFVNKRKVHLFDEYNDPEDPDPYYVTHLTAFVVMQSTADKNQDMPTFTFKEDEMEELFAFYSTKGVYYLFEYEQLTYATLERFAKCVLQTHPDYEGECVGMEAKGAEEEIAFRKLGERLVKPVERFDYTLVPSPEQPKASKNAKKEKGATKGKEKKKTAALPVRYENRGTQLPEEEEEEVACEAVATQPPIVNHLPVAISQPFQIMLATVWENVEQAVYNDVTCLFLNYRTFIADHEKFVHHFVDIMRDYLRQPHDKQRHVERFQCDYNELEDEYRNDEEVKAEYFYRVDELRDTLTRITDEERDRNAAYKEQLLRNEWMSRVMRMYGCGHTVLLRVELDQQRVLLQILNDYYVGVATKFPCAKTLRTIELHDFPAARLAEFHAYVYARLNDRNATMVADDGDDLFTKHMDGNYHAASALIDEYRTQCAGVSKEMENLYKNREKSGKFNGDVDVDLFPKLLDEWRELIDGLHEKCALRLLTLTKRFKEKTVNLLTSYVAMTATVDGLISERYENEMRGIRTMGDVFESAIEAEVPILQRLVLDDDQFYVDPNVYMKLESLPPLIVKDGFVDEYLFPLESLEKLIVLFGQLAPTGTLPEQSFAFALYDIVRNKSGSGIYVPKKWRRLTLGQLTEVIGLLFENNSFVDWHDFVLYNLNVDYPKCGDLLRAKRHFRKYDENLTEAIAFYHLEHATFWIDNRVDGERRIIKLLCKMYETRYEYANYARMLLDFCKDHNPIKGFLKAVQLCLGAFVCVDAAEAAQFVSKMAGKCVAECTCDDSSCEMIDARRSTNAKPTTVCSEAASSSVSAEPLEEASEKSTITECDSVVNSAFFAAVNSSSNFGMDEQLAGEDEEVIVAEECGSYCKCENSETNEWIRDVASCECSYESICEPSPNVILLQENDEWLQMCDACEDYDDKIPIVYTIPFTILVKILGVTIFAQESARHTLNPYHKKFEHIYDDCRNPQIGNKVFTHVLFNNTDFKKYIGRHYKFLLKNVQRILNSIINSSKK